MTKEFKAQVNLTVFLFLLVYCGYTVYLLIMRQMSEFYTVLVAGIAFFVYFLGFRPCSYVVDRKTIYIKYRLRKAKEIDLMQCETICDPVERFSEFIRRAHAIEIYTTARKRYCFFPKQKERVAFVEAVVRGNKRIHCTVQEYTDVHRQLERKQRKERRKAEKRAAKEKQRGSE